VAPANEGEKLKTRRAIISVVIAVLLFHGTHVTQAASQRLGVPAEVRGQQGTVFALEAPLSDPSNSDSRIAIICDGTDEGIRSLLDKDCELAVASRKMRPEEFKEAQDKGLVIREAVVGFVGIAVVVHTTNPVQELTVDEMYKIISGTITMWNQVGGPSEPISVITIGKRGSGIRAYNTQANPGGAVRLIPAKSRRSLERRNELALIRFGETNLEEGVKLLAISETEQSLAILPSQEAIDTGAYPIVSALRLYIDWKHAPQGAKAFFNYCASQRRRTPCK
jgi:phosphate transport system substrate-binding protein